MVVSLAGAAGKIINVGVVHFTRKIEVVMVGQPFGEVVIYQGAVKRQQEGVDGDNQP
jgi:hypothetical protein